MIEAAARGLFEDQPGQSREPAPKAPRPLPRRS